MRLGALKFFLFCLCICIGTSFLPLYCFCMRFIYYLSCLHCNELFLFEFYFSVAYHPKQESGAYCALYKLSINYMINYYYVQFPGRFYTKTVKCIYSLRHVCRVIMDFTLIESY